MKLHNFTLIALVAVFVLGTTVSAARDSETAPSLRRALQVEDVVCPTAESLLESPEYVLSLEGNNPSLDDIANVAAQLSRCAQPLDAVTDLTLDLFKSAYTTVDGLEDVLAHFPNVERVKLQFARNHITNEGLAAFPRLLAHAKRLQYLALNLSFNYIDNFTFIGDAFAACTNLTEVEINARGSWIVDASGLQEAFTHAPQLRAVSLAFGNSYLTNISQLATVFAPLKNLDNVYLELSGTLVEDLSPLADVFAVPGATLKTLYLDVAYLKFESFAPVVSALRATPNVQSLEIYIDQVTTLQNTTQVADAIRSVPRLEHLIFSFSSYMNTDETHFFDVTALAKALESVPDLRELAIYLSGLSNNDTSFLEYAFQPLKRLQRLLLSIKHSEIEDVSLLVHAFSNLESLTSLSLILEQNRIKSGFQGLEIALTHDIAPRKAFCPFKLSIVLNPISMDQALRSKFIQLRKVMYQEYKNVTCEDAGFLFNF